MSRADGREMYRGVDWPLVWARRASVKVHGRYRVYMDIGDRRLSTVT